MKPEIKALWLRALRDSEKYTQTKSRLRSSVIAETPTRDAYVLPDGQYGYCCLGVLADIAVEEGHCTWDTEFEAISRTSVDHRLCEFTSLPVALHNWAGIPEYVTNPENSEDEDDRIHVQDTLIGMNDEQEKTFAEIADWIEENL